MTAVPRVVLAGGRASPELAAKIHHSIRAMAVYRGKRLLDYVIEALAASDSSSPVLVVGEVPDSSDYRRVPDQGDFVSNIVAGVRAFEGSEWVVVTSVDMPYLTDVIVSNFVESAIELGTATNSELVYPIVRVADCYARYPKLKRTAIKLREGEFTGGNMVLVRPGFILKSREVIESTYAARKHPFRLAAMLGLTTILRLAISQTISSSALSIAMLEEKVGGLVNGKVAALISRDPEIATDLDRPSDFEGAEAREPAEQPGSI